MKESLDQWGTIAFAPPLFAPAEDPVPAPFELRGDNFTLNGLYADYNKANGRSLFSQRTLSQLYGADGMGQNTTAQAVERAKADIFRTKVDRNIARSSTETRNLEHRYETARVEAAAAQSALENRGCGLISEGPRNTGCFGCVSLCVEN